MGAPPRPPGARWSHDIEMASTDNTVEMDETPDASRSEGDEYDDDAGLTEVAMPIPSQADDPLQDHLEQEEVVARRLGSRASRDDNMGPLTELRVPSMTFSDRRSSQRSRRWSESSHQADPEQFPPDVVENEKEEPEETHRILMPVTEVYVLGHLIFFAILGTLSRLGVEALNTYPDAPVASPVLWANVGGSFIFGFLAEDRTLFREEWGTRLEDWSFNQPANQQRRLSHDSEVGRKHLKVKKTIPLYIGLATGFCGSFTSFSTFVRDAFLALSGQLATVTRAEAQSPSNRGYDFEAALAILIVHVACSLSALKFGAHLALATRKAMPTLPFRFVRKILDPAIVFFGLGCWIGAIFMTVWPPKDEWRGQVLMALVFAPVGCLFRFYLSKHLNQRVPGFPMGTFSANISGTAALGICYIIQRSGHRSVISCQILSGIIDGFCGCATTVSTWVGELETLQRRHSYIYGLTSLAVGLSVLVIIIGSLLWSEGFHTPSCV